MQYNRANQKISIHHLYSKNQLPINNVYRQGTNYTIPATPTHIYPAIISPIRQHNQYQQNINGINASRQSAKKINTSHFVIGEPVGYTHSNVLPPKYKPFQPSSHDTYTNLNSSMSKQALQNTKSSPNLQKKLPNISINRSLQALHQNNPIYPGQSFYKNTEARDKEKDQRIENFFNQTNQSNDEQQIRNILAQYKQVIEKKEDNIDTLERSYGENVLQAQQSLQQMKHLLEDLIRIKRQEITQKEKKYQRRKNITSKIQNLLKTQARGSTELI